MDSIYLDYMATTPVDQAVIDKMSRCLGRSGCFGNPSSAHRYGYNAAKMISHARQQVATLFNTNANDIIFTSGATEANNLAIKGACDFYQRKGRHIITMATEHKAVLDPCEYLSHQEFEITYLKPGKNGVLDLVALRDAIRSDTVLISIMFVNNETGIIQDVKAIGALAREHGILFHTDATQAVGKLAIDLNTLPIDLLSFSAHKVYGPKGVGGLYIRSQPSKLRLQAQIHGGGHQQGFRSGTLPTHQIVGMGAAFEIASSRLKHDELHTRELRDNLLAGLSKLGGVQVNADLNCCIAGVLNIRIDNILADTLMLRVPGLSFSSGSACNAVDNEPSHVLTAMGLSTIEARSSVRLSVGRYTTAEEIQQSIKLLQQHINFLRKISPLNA